MSWIKKIVGKKGSTDAEADSSSAKDETVFYGDEQKPPAEPTPSRSSMISDLAGWESESSADLSGELESAQREQAEGSNSESISLDFDDASDPSPAGDENSGSQQPGSAPATSNLPELEFDSEPKLHTDFNKPPPPSPANQADEISNPASLAATTGGGSIHESDDHADHDFETIPPSAQGGLIEQMAGGFDLDLGEADEPTSEAFLVPPRVDEPATAIFDSPSPASAPSDIDELATAKFDPPPPADPGVDETDLSNADLPADSGGVDLTSTADGEKNFDELATAKLDQPALTPAASPSPEESVDEFDATVITTAAVEPATAGGADYVTGWLVVVDGPGKGQSRPIRSGINAVGRSPDQAIPLYFGAKSDGEISRRDHARVIYDPRGNNFKLIHGESRNLTYLNDEAVLQITDLKPYDRIVMGKTTLLFIPLCGNIFRW
ncbi:MAG: FHA domain-containing protein [Gammaproteobacteria bacterium]